jgi:hypothetical protein
MLQFLSNMFRAMFSTKGGADGLEPMQGFIKIRLDKVYRWLKSQRKRR